MKHALNRMATRREDVSPYALFESFFERAADQRRTAFDPLLYDTTVLTQSERCALLDRRLPDHALVVAHPRGMRRVTIYRDFSEWRPSLDGLTRVIALAGPAAGAVGAAALARQIANAVDEPVLTVAPRRGPAGLAREMTAPWSIGASIGATMMRSLQRSLAGGFSPEALAQAFSTEQRPELGRSASEVDRLLAVLKSRADGVRLMVGHGLGAHTLAEALAAEAALDDGAYANASAPTVSDRQIVTFGAAAEFPEGSNPVQVLGACDAYGWSLSSLPPAGLRVEAGCGHHLNPRWPGALPLASILGELVAKRPLRERPPARRRLPEAANVSD